MPTTAPALSLRSESSGIPAAAIASSAAFASPVASPVVALVAEPGRYRFGDFLRVGLPMLVITAAVTLVVTPLVFPL